MRHNEFLLDDAEPNSWQRSLNELVEMYLPAPEDRP